MRVVAARRQKKNQKPAAATAYNKTLPPPLA
jgi:hypothetical protein